MSEIVNPYIAGAPVTEARMFFGREDVFQWIENSIAGQYADHILVIHGQRRVGKTSVLKQLGNRLPKRYIPVFFDLQGRTHTSLDQFLWWLAREIVRVLKQERGIEVPLPEKESFTDTEYFENRFLPDLKPALGDGTLLLTFDEFDNLEESEVKEDLARPLIDHLRRLMGNTGLNFIFSIGSSGRKLENMQAAYTEFFKTALYKKISFLTEEQTRSLIARPVENIIEYEKQSATRIYQIAGGHPYFTQLTCHELFAKCQRTDQRIIKEADIDSVLEDVIERGTVNLKFVWDEASDIEKWELAALAQLEKTDNRSLTEYLRKHRVRFSESDLTSALLHLREKDILTNENRFVIYLLKLWLQKNRPIEQAREELTEVNPIANRYIEIGLEFKDSGMYDKAIESFREALAVAKDNVQAQVNIALAYMDQKAYSNAIVEFEKALTMDDEDVSARSGLCEAHLSLGDTAMQKGRMKDAVQSYQRVLAINAEHTEARGRMAEIARQRAEKALTDGRDEEALSAFADAMKYTPEDPTLSARVDSVKSEKKAKVVAALVARSAKEAGTKNWDGAVKALEDALHLSPEDTRIQQKLTTAKSEQEKALLEGLLARADAAEKSSRWKDAIAALNQYLGMNPDEAIQIRLESLRGKQRESQLISLRTQARGLAKSERYDDALKLWQEYLAMGPAEESIKNEISEVTKAQAIANSYAEAQKAYASKNYDGAINLLKGIINQDENYKDASRLLAESIELRRTARKWWQGKWVWGVVLSSVVLLVAWFALRPGSPLLSALFSPTAASIKTNAPTDPSGSNIAPATVAATTAPPTATAAPLPYTWTRLNSGQFLPRDTATAIVVNPNDSGVIYIGTENAGIFKSIDGGLSWLLANHGLSRVMISSLVIDPENPNNVYAGTRSGRLFTTHDAGNSWEDITPQSAQSSDMRTYIFIDPQDPAHLYYSESSNIFESSNRGSSWQEFKKACPANINSITLQKDSADNAVIYISTDNPPNCEPGVYRTSDRGVTWEYLGPDDPNFWQFSQLIVIMKSNGEHVILGMQGSGELFTSFDDGKSWTITNQECNTFYTNPSDAILCGREDGLSISRDEGRSWQNIPGIDKQVTAIWASDDLTQFILGTSDGLIMSNDGGKTWTDHSSGLGARRLELEMSPDGSQLFVRDRTQGPIGTGLSCCDQNSLFYSTNGQTWELATSQGYGLALDASSSTVYRAQGNNLLISSDNGKTWKEQTFPFWADKPSLGLFAHPEQSGLLYAADDNERTLFISQDSGLTWEEYNPQYEHLAYVQLFFGQENTVYMVPFNQAFRSVDRGKTWNACGSETVDIPAAKRFAIDPHDDNRVFLASIWKGLLYSTDACQSWETRNNGLGNQFINSITIDPNNPDTLYLGTDGGAYISFDSGRSWGQVNDGLFGTTVVYSIVADKESNVYAATPYGIFKLEGK